MGNGRSVGEASARTEVAGDRARRDCLRRRPVREQARAQQADACRREGGREEAAARPSRGSTHSVVMLPAGSGAAARGFRPGAGDGEGPGPTRRSAARRPERGAAGPARRARRAGRGRTRYAPLDAHLHRSRPWAASWGSAPPSASALPSSRSPPAPDVRRDPGGVGGRAVAIARPVARRHSRRRRGADAGAERERPAPTPAASRSRLAVPARRQAGPALTAPQVGGGTIDLAALRGKPVWVVFTAHLLPALPRRVPAHERLRGALRGPGLVVLAIHVREGEQTVAPFVSSLNVVFPVGLDEDGSRARTWDAAALPGPLLHRRPGGRARRRARRDRSRRDGPGAPGDPARRDGEAVNAGIARGRRSDGFAVDPAPPRRAGRRPPPARSRPTPGGLLVVCDFDGTLAPISPGPDGADDPAGRPPRAAAPGPDRPPAPGPARARDPLGAHGAGRGRPRARGRPDLPRRPRHPGRRPPGRRRRASGSGWPTTRAWPGITPAARRLGDEVERLLGGAAWLFVEPKGPSVAFHFRAADDVAAARARILAALDDAGAALPAALRGPQFRHVEGRRIVELRPEDAGGEGRGRRAAPGAPRVDGRAGHRGRPLATRRPSRWSPASARRAPGREPPAGRSRRPRDAPGAAGGGARHPAGARASAVVLRALARALEAEDRAGR